MNTVPMTPPDSEIEALMAETAELLGNCVVPLYINLNNRLTHMGTAFFVRDRGAFYLVTAAHVLDLQQHGELCFYITPGVLRNLSGEARLSPANGDRSTDPFDVGVLRLSGEHLPPYPEVGKGYIELEHLAQRALPRTDKHYMLIGYPSSKNQPNRQAREVGARTFALRAASVDADSYGRVGVDPRDHIVLGFDPKQQFDSKGSRIDFPKPQGMSGGPVWLVYDHGAKAGASGFQVVGVAIEHRKLHRAIVATDAGVARYIIESWR